MYDPGLAIAGRSLETVSERQDMEYNLEAIENGMF